MATPILKAWRDNEDGSGATTITTATAMSNTTGNFIAVGVRCNSTSITVTGVADTAGNTYFLVDRDTSSVTSTELWYAYNITGNASNQVTATFSSSVGSRYIIALEVTGIDTVSPFDTSAKGHVTSSGAIPTGTFTTSTATQVVIAAHQVEANGVIWAAYAQARPSASAVAATGATQSLGMSMWVLTAVQTGVTFVAECGSGAPKQIVAGTFKYTAGGGAVGSAYAFA